MKQLFSLVLVAAMFLSACAGQPGHFEGDLTLENIAWDGNGSVTVPQGTVISTKNGASFTQGAFTLDVPAGMCAIANSEVTINMTNQTFTGHVVLCVTPSTTQEASATPIVPTSTLDSVTETPTGALNLETVTPSPSATPATQSESWICYTEGAEQSLTYTQLMDSNPNRVEYKVNNISECPYGEGNVFFHWTQIGATGDKLEDTQGWLRMGDKENVINECSLQTGWCLASNN